MSKEAMKLALEALGLLVEERSSEAMDDGYQAIKALEEALAKQEQGEPLCTAAMFDDAFLAKSGLSPDTKLYTTPQQRKPLTDEQKFALIEKCLGLKKRTEDTVIDRYTGLFTDSARYFILIDAAYNFKE